MKKQIFILLFSIVATFCHAQKTNDLKSNEILRAKNWLIENVERELNSSNGLDFNSNDQAEGKSKSIYTKMYESYKSDALQIDLEGGMTSAQFKKKWERNFQTKFAGEGVGFLISAQDYGMIVVSECNFIENKTQKAFWFKTTIFDSENKLEYYRDIKVIPSGNSFLIADILEYN
ncbi:MAG: hypothetical protein C4K58_06725 [Flavobacteriaceae bacterium]|nr:MAG: hypothetical protein C4K58_06725 [Flavobacteriaceae bacterium]